MPVSLHSVWKSFFPGQVNYIVDINFMDSVNFEVLVLSLCLLECNSAADFFVVGCRVVDRYSTSGRCHGGRKAGRCLHSVWLAVLLACFPV